MRYSEFKQRLKEIFNNLPFEIFYINGKPYTEKNFENGHPFYLEIKDIKYNKKYAKIYFNKRELIIQGRKFGAFYLGIGIPKKDVNKTNILISLLRIPLKDKKEVLEEISKHYQKFDKELFLKNLKEDIGVNENNVEINEEDEKLYIILPKLNEKQKEYMQEYRKILQNKIGKLVILDYKI